MARKRVLLSHRVGICSTLCDSSGSNSGRVSDLVESVMGYGTALRTQPAKKTGVRKTTGEDRRQDEPAARLHALPSSMSQSFSLTAWTVQTPMQATWVFLLPNSSVIYSAPFPAFEMKFRMPTVLCPVLLAFNITFPRLPNSTLL